MGNTVIKPQGDETQVEKQPFPSTLPPPPLLFNNFPVQCVHFAVRAVWEWHQKATGVFLCDQAHRHRDICRGKGSLHQQTECRHKQTQINRLTPSQPEAQAHAQVLANVCRDMHVHTWMHGFSLSLQLHAQKWGTNVLNVHGPLGALLGITLGWISPVRILYVAKMQRCSW